MKAAVEYCLLLVIVLLKVAERSFLYRSHQAAINYAVAADTAVLVCYFLFGSRVFNNLADNHYNVSKNWLPVA
jgi:hypothetical protein